MVVTANVLLFILAFVCFLISARGLWVAAPVPWRSAFLVPLGLAFWVLSLVIASGLR